MIQCAASGTSASCTSVAASRMTVAIMDPNENSPPIASTRILSFPRARNALLSTASCVERGVVLTLFLVEALRIARELVREAVKVDALATQDQAFHIGAAEAELP